MKTEKPGKVIFPRVGNWLHSHQSYIHHIHEYSPIPENVVNLPARQKNKKEKTPQTKLGKEWSLLSEYTCPVFSNTEKCIDYIRYDGDSRWTMRSINMLEGDTVTKRFGTKALIDWVAWRETALFDDGILPKEECEFESRLGIVLSTLLLIAMRERADYCVQCIGRILRHEPLVKPKLTKLKITKIKGVAIKGIWVRRYAAFFVAETPDGEVYLSPPNELGITSGFGPGVKNTGPQNRAENVPLTKRARYQVRELKDDYLEASLEAKARNGR